MSEVIHTIHWGIYIGSLISVLGLFTRMRKWAALWIGILFASHALFGGCVLISWENYYRVQEGLVPLENILLTDRVSSSYGIVWSLLIVMFSTIIFILEQSNKKTT